MRIAGAFPPVDSMTRTNSGYTLGAIVERFGGELVGDAEVVVKQVAPLSSALVLAHQLSLQSKISPATAKLQGRRRDHGGYGA